MGKLKINKLAYAFAHALGDGQICEYRADQNMLYELEQTTELPAAAWITGYGENLVELPKRNPEDPDEKPRFVGRRGRLHELAWAASASWREDNEPDLTFSQFRSLLPVGPEWDDLAGKLDGLIDKAIQGNKPPDPTPALSAPLTPSSPGSADTSKVEPS